MLNAYDLAQELDDKFWTAMSAREISAIYNLTYNHVEELKYAIIAYDNFKETNKHLHTICAASDLSRSYFNMNDSTKALEIFYQTMDSAKERDMSALQADLHIQLGKFYLSTKDYNRAKQSWEDVCHLPVANAEDSIYLGLTYVYLNQIPDATAIFDKYGERTQKPVRYYLAYKINKASGKYREALRNFESFDSITNEALRGKTTQGMSNAVTIHFEQAKQLEKANNEKAMFRLWMIIAIILLVLVILCWLFYGRYKHNREIISQYTDLARQLQEDPILDYASTYQDDEDVKLYTKMNFPHIHYLSAFVGSRFKVGIWEPNVNVGLRKQWLTVDYDGGRKKLDNPRVMLQWQNAIHLPWDTWLNIDMEWMSDGNEENRFVKSAQDFGLNAKLYKAFFNNTFSVTLEAYNIFNKRNYRETTYCHDVTVYMADTTNNREYWLTLQYTFNATNDRYRGRGAGASEKSRL